MRDLRPLPVLLISFAARLVSGAEAAADTNAVWLAEHYTKYERRIPMRDGVRLFTRVYVPKDDSQAWPIILTRTPYALKPYGADNYNDPIGSFRTLAKDKFILVTQDVRGRYGSEGEYVHVRPFNRPGKRYQVSSGGGLHAMWGPTSKEICYMSGSSMMSVSIGAQGELVQVGRPVKLFDLPTIARLQVDYRDFDMTGDGQRFITTYVANPELARRRIDVLINANALLKRAEKKGVAE